MPPAVITRGGWAGSLGRDLSLSGLVGSFPRQLESEGIDEAFGGFDVVAESRLHPRHPTRLGGLAVHAAGQPLDRGGWRHGTEKEAFQRPQLLSCRFRSPVDAMIPDSGVALAVI
jgi:hypothetical protein